MKRLYFFNLILWMSFTFLKGQNDASGCTAPGCSGDSAVKMPFMIECVGGLHHQGNEFSIDDFVKIRIDRNKSAEYAAALKTEMSTLVLKRAGSAASKTKQDSVWKMMYDSICKAPALDDLLKKTDGGKIIMWINGVAFSNLKVWKYNRNENTLLFKMEYDSTKNSGWQTLYGYAYRHSFKTGNKKVCIQIGSAEKTMTNGMTIVLKIRENWMMFWGSCAALFVLGIFIWLSRKFYMLRDFRLLNDDVKVELNEPKKATNPKTREAQTSAEAGATEATGAAGTTEGGGVVYQSQFPRSLARTQLAFWTLIVGLSMIFIWMNLDELSAISTTVVTLLGISGGTTVLSKIIDASRNAEAGKVDAKTFNEKYKTEGFWKDILSDGRGISVHRFQLVMFNIGLGCYFLWHVIYYLDMPSFSDNMLLLIGISNATYAGAKLKEN